MNPLELLPIAVVFFVVLVVPGPDFLIVTRAALSGRQNGLFAGLGVATAILVWAASTKLGLTLLFERFAWLYGSLKLLGAAYLIYLGVQTWRAASQSRAVTALEREVLQISPLAAWKQGFLTNISNPKAVVFFGSIFTALVPSHLPAWGISIAVLVPPLLAVLWFTLVALLFSTGGIQRIFLRVRKTLDRVAGAVMMLFGVRLLAER